MVGNINGTKENTRSRSKRGKRRRRRRGEEEEEKKEERRRDKLAPSGILGGQVAVSVIRLQPTRRACSFRIKKQHKTRKSTNAIVGQMTSHEQALRHNRRERTLSLEEQASKCIDKNLHLQESGELDTLAIHSGTSDPAGLPRSLSLRAVATKRWLRTDRAGLTSWRKVEESRFIAKLVAAVKVADVAYTRTVILLPPILSCGRRAQRRRHAKRKQICELAAVCRGYRTTRAAGVLR